jgi:hypothetical protein
MMTVWPWLVSGGGSPGGVPRDPRVDVVRGLALIFIFIDHLPANPLANFTLHAFGFADAAEVFVLLAGFGTALAFGSSWSSAGYGTAAARLLGRAAKLWVAHILVFVAAASLVATAAMRTGNPLYFELVNLLPLFNEPHTALADAILLSYQPHLMDILPMYILFLASFPLVAWLLRRSPIAALALSGSLYLVIAWTGFNLRNGPNAGEWFFNPIAWQFLFVIGAVAGAGAMAGVALPRSRALVAAAVLYCVFAFLVASRWSGLDVTAVSALVGVDWQLDINKTNLSAWRLVHVLALAYAFAVLVPAGAAFLGGRAAQAFALCGRRSLQVFCLGILLSVLGHIVILEFGSSWAVLTLVNGAGIALLFACAYAVDWYETLAAGKKPRVGARNVELASG